MPTAIPNPAFETDSAHSWELPYLPTAGDVASAVTAPACPRAIEGRPRRRGWLAFLATAWRMVADVLAERIGVSRRPQEPGPGVRIGSYRLTSLVGEGGMGQVWAAEDSAGHSVAIKMMRADAWTTAHQRDLAVQRFRREAEVTAQVASAHVARVLDSGTYRGEPYYVMELLPGLDLREHVELRGAMAPAEAAGVLSQLCAGLAVAHERGVIHRDIKPDNVVVCGDGGRPESVKIVDFGVAAVPQRAGDPSLTCDTAIVGTPQYLAPEAQLGAVGPAGDIYAVGCVAFFLLTGKAAFRGRTPVHVLDAHRQARRAPLPEGLPEELVGLVTSCLSRDPEDRPASAAQLALSFAQLADPR